jgi:hypothetical protein
MVSCCCWVLYPGCIVDGWVDRWCADVSWVWWIPNSNAAASHTTTIYAITGTTPPRLQGTTTSYNAPSYYTEALKYNSAPSYTTKEPEYNTEAPNYYTT